MTDDPITFTSVIKNINLVVQSAAILVGGVWAYLKFVKGRTFRPRLEPVISVDTFSRGRHIYILVTGTLKNVGGSRVDITKKGTGYRVLATKPDAPNNMITADWTHQASFDIFENHDWIEPGETVSEHRLVILNHRGWIAIKLELQVHSKKVVWHAMAIAELKYGSDYAIEEGGRKEPVNPYAWWIEDRRFPGKKVHRGRFR